MGPSLSRATYFSLLLRRQGTPDRRRLLTAEQLVCRHRRTVGADAGLSGLQRGVIPRSGMALTLRKSCKAELDSARRCPPSRRRGRVAGLDALGPANWRPESAAHAHEFSRAATKKPAHRAPA